MSDIQALFNATTNLPVLPKVVEELLRLLDADDPDMKSVIGKINRDPVIAAKVLRQANTAHYGASRHIKTLDEAVALIGFARLVTLVIASGVTEAMTKVPGVDLPKFWKHSFVSAAIARQIALDVNRATRSDYQPELVYLGGLLHSIGQLVMHIFFPNAGYVFEQARDASSALERKSIERTHLGVDHCQIGQELTRRWMLPMEIQQMVRYYAEPQHPEADKHAVIVHLSEHISCGMAQAMSAETIFNDTNNVLVGVLVPNKEVWQDKLEEFSVFLSEADAFI